MSAAYNETMRVALASENALENVDSIIVLLVLVLLCEGEIVRAVGRSDARDAARAFRVILAPLLLCFAIIVATRILALG